MNFQQNKPHTRLTKQRHVQLSRPTDNNNNSNSNRNLNSNRGTQQEADFFSLRGIKEWPARIRDGFNAKLDEAKSKSETGTEYAFEIVKVFSGIIIWALCLFCTIIVPIILFFLGLFNLDNCQDRPQLPYLVFGVGFVMTTSNLFNLALALDIPILTNHRLLSADTKNTIASIINILFNCVVAFLYILTTYMVYTVGALKHHQESSHIEHKVEDSSEEEPPVVAEYQAVPDCGSLLYQFTFWFITLTLCLFALLGLIALILFAYNRYRLAIIRGLTPRSQAGATTDLSTNPQTNGTGSPFGAGTANNRMI